MNVPRYHVVTGERHVWMGAYLGEGLPMADELDDIREKEEANYKTSLKVLGDSVSLVEDLLDVHALITTTAARSRLILKPEYYVTLHFSVAARYYLTIGTLAALRAHPTDAVRNGRMAIECAAFAARVKANPDMAPVWIDAGLSDEAYERYLKVFSSGKIFPDEHPVLRELGRRFDTTSKLSHPSLYALAQHVRIGKTDTGVEVMFHYFPVDKPSLTEPARTFFWTVDTHFGAVRVFVDVLARLLERERAVIEVRVNAIDAKLTLHKNRWREAILRKPDKSVDPSALIVIPPF